MVSIAAPVVATIASKLIISLALASFCLPSHLLATKSLHSYSTSLATASFRSASCCSSSVPCSLAHTWNLGARVSSHFSPARDIPVVLAKNVVTRSIISSVYCYRPGPEAALRCRACECVGSWFSGGACTGWVSSCTCSSRPAASRS